MGIKKGDLVVCVDARPAAWHEPKDMMIHLGDIFSVIHYERVIPFGWAFPRALIVIAGTKGKVNNWDAYRFRPLRPNEADARESWDEMLKKPYLADAPGEG